MKLDIDLIDGELCFIQVINEKEYCFSIAELEREIKKLKKREKDIDNLLEKAFRNIEAKKKI